MPTLYISLLASHEGFVTKPAKRKQFAKGRSVLLQGLGKILGSHGSARKAAKRKKRAKAKRARTKVLVIWAGLAGLCAAYELKQSGYDVEIVEARHEVGGRTRIRRGIAGKKAMDAGAELIGDNHPLWLHYKARFGLRLSKVEEYGNSPIRFHGKTLTWEQSSWLNKQMGKLVKKLNSQAELILDPYEPWINPDAKELDKQSLKQWAERMPTSNRARYALYEMMETDGGVSADQQSLLGVLAMVKGGGLNRFWKDTELHRCKGGTQKLAFAFEKHLKRRGVKIYKCTQVCSIHVEAKSVSVKTWKLPEPRPGEGTVRVRDGEQGQSGPSFEAQFAILAIPPSVWDTVRDLSPRPLKRLLRGPQCPQMGKNTKFLMGFKSRFWKDAALGPTLTEDDLVGLTWETTEADRKGKIGMVAFSGGGPADKLSERFKENPTAVPGDVYKKLDPVYKGIKDKATGSCFINWPEEEWAKASYCFPKPGDVTYWGPIYKAGFQNRLFFAGEHTSWAFMGYMEGALSSGYRVAARIALRDTLGIG